MIDVKSRIAEIERLGISVDDVRREAGVHRATWDRWKAGTYFPQMQKWARVEEAVNALQGDQIAQAA